MTVILADVLGYCMGVRRAVESALCALSQNPQKKVYSLGPLIHNETALKQLSLQGLLVKEESELSSIEPYSVVIIRAHGVPPKVIAELEQKNCTIVNATCPRVVASQNIAEKYSNEDLEIILAGDKNHGEVTGIQGYAGKNFVLVQNNDEAKNLVPKKQRAVLLSQTTFSPKEFEKISVTLKEKFANLTVMNTICPATKERQNALLSLCKKVDGIIVAGGKNSANTRRLFVSASENCAKASLVESANSIPSDFFSLKTVGITAGASTPDSVIQEIKEKLESTFIS